MTALPFGSCSRKDDTEGREDIPQKPSLERKNHERGNKNSLRKIIAQVKDIPTHLVVERTTEQETTADKSLPSSLLTKQADHFAPHSVEKSKKHHIPSIALALLVVFATLTIFSLFRQSLPALAASAHIAHKASAAQAHDNTPPDIGGEVSKSLVVASPGIVMPLQSG